MGGSEFTSADHLLARFGITPYGDKVKYLMKWD